MWYVYSRYISSGREDFCGMYETEKEAAMRCASLYAMDKNMNCLGEYYYFIKKH